MDLSSLTHHSVNDGISPELCSLVYTKIDDAVHDCICQFVTALHTESLSYQTCNPMLPQCTSSSPNHEWPPRPTSKLLSPAGLRPERGEEEGPACVRERRLPITPDILSIGSTRHGHEGSPRLMTSCFGRHFAWVSLVLCGRGSSHAHHVKPFCHTCSQQQTSVSTPTHPRLLWLSTYD